MESKSTNTQIVAFKVKQHIKGLLNAIGENPNREGLIDTPTRVAQSCKEIYGGYDIDIDSVLTAFKMEGYDEMVTLKDIEFYSTCEHHLLPFYGKAHISYVPHKEIIGLSKLARLLDIYAKRLQVQERLTIQVADILNQCLKPKGVGVMVEAKHCCMLCRGVKKQESVMVTTALHGVYEKPEVRAEFLNSVK